MNEKEVIDRANALGVRPMSLKEIEEVWHQSVNLRGRLEDFFISASLFGLLNTEEQTEVIDAGSRLNELAEKVRLEVMRRRDTKEFITYR
jgi:hypothetical protein